MSRTYRSYEEFEREELRRGHTVGASLDDWLDRSFVEELDLEAQEARARAAEDKDEEAEDDDEEDDGDDE